MRLDRLAVSWLILLGLSAVTLLLARHGGDGSGAGVGVAGAAALLALAVAKGREILLHYLELDRAGMAWRVLLSGYLVALCGAILLIYAAGSLGWIGPAGGAR
ncbi:cytochrome C oxidase subunit IV family protein [Azospirillum doebereinerae]|uniref:Cytochrome C oxidase subunit IV n=1 Tax=Azospirillum doebereinerae TaxID=92933 RepID=A0A3S0VIV0_9PROT|nr:cytochrome C oxidase subunit IV family protein [Azospirillum doebereinerae]MCG5238828.1 cytochrome C oxidase subunit IV family protein [Azospirillum doebereinerae]RUQ72135.1 hypothetical protein EJ913_11280 [Azospirillum doebereinerae]